MKKYKVKRIFTNPSNVQKSESSQEIIISNEQLKDAMKRYISENPPGSSVRNNGIVQNDDGDEDNDAANEFNLHVSQIPSLYKFNIRCVQVFRSSIKISDIKLNIV